MIFHIEMKMFLETFRDHWREYASEAIGLGAFMVSACLFAVLIFHPAFRLEILGDDLKRILMGLAMGATAILIINSPFGKRSGAHINPAVTITFWRLGKIKNADAGFYIASQFAGAVAGIFIARSILGEAVAAPEINFVITAPAMNEIFVAFVAEFAISFWLMLTVLMVSNNRRLSKFTPYFAGGLLAFYIWLESPVSGTSMNPARSFASAIFAGMWQSWWIYFIAPPIGMLFAAEIFVRANGVHKVLCAKLNHYGNRTRCIFNCRYGENI